MMTHRVIRGGECRRHPGYGDSNIAKILAIRYIANARAELCVSSQMRTTPIHTPRVGSQYVRTKSYVRTNSDTRSERYQKDTFSFYVVYSIAT